MWLAQKQLMHLGQGLGSCRANSSPQSLLWSYSGAISVLPLHPCQPEISSTKDKSFLLNCYTLFKQKWNNVLLNLVPGKLLGQHQCTALYKATYIILFSGLQWKVQGYFKQKWSWQLLTNPYFPLPQQQIAAQS